MKQSVDEKITDRRGVDARLLRQKRGELAGDALHAADAVAFDVERQDRVVQRQPQQKPAVAVGLIQCLSGLWN